MQKLHFRSSKYWQPAGIFLVSALIAGLFYYMNAMTPLYADDYCYSLSFATLERIDSVTQIPASMAAHYQTTNGRIPVHALAQLFLLAGDRWFNYFNTLGFLLLLYTIYFHIYGSFRKFSPGALALIAMLLFVTAPAFGQSYLWITGAANYLYGILIVLLALAPYRKQAQDNGGRRTPPAEIAMAVGGLLLGFLAGWTNENTAVALVAMMLAYLLLYRSRRIPLRGWHITELIGAVTGCVCMLTAPGNAARMAAVGADSSLILWIQRAVNYTYHLFTYLHIPVLLFTLLLCLYISQNRDRLVLRSGLKKLLSAIAPSAVTWIYFLGFLGAVYSMVMAPGFPPRAWSGPVILALIMVGNLSTITDLNRVKIAKIGFMLYMLVFTFCTLETGQYQLEDIKTKYDQREALLETAAAESRSVVEIPTISSSGNPMSCFTIYGDIQKDNSHWLNEAIATYYGFDEVHMQP